MRSASNPPPPLALVAASIERYREGAPQKSSGDAPPRKTTRPWSCSSGQSTPAAAAVETAGVEEVMLRRCTRACTARPVRPAASHAQRPESFPARGKIAAPRSAGVARRRDDMLALMREAEPLSRHVQHQQLSGSSVAMPLFGIDLAVDSRARDYFTEGAPRPPPPPPATPATPATRTSSASARVPPIERVRGAAAVEGSVAEDVSGSAFRVVPAAVMAASPYLQLLQERQDAAKAREREAAAAVAEDVFAVFQTMLGEIMLEPAQRGRTLDEGTVRAAFEAFVRGGSREQVAAALGVAAEVQPPPMQHRPTCEAQAMDDVPAPSGAVAASPRASPPKLRMHARDKRRHLDSLLQRAAEDSLLEGTDAVGTNGCRALENTMPRCGTPVDVLRDTKAPAALNQFAAFHGQRSELAVVRRADRQAAFTARLYQRHSSKLPRPVLQRRTTGEATLASTQGL